MNLQMLYLKDCKCIKKLDYIKIKLYNEKAKIIS